MRRLARDILGRCREQRWIKMHFQRPLTKLESDGALALTMPAGAIQTASIDEMRIGQRKPDEISAARAALVQELEKVRPGWRVPSSTISGTSFSRTIQFKEPVPAPEHAAAKGDPFTLSCRVKRTTATPRPITFQNMDALAYTRDEYIVNISIDLEKMQFL